MNLSYPLLTFSLLLLGNAQTALAVQALGQVSPGPTNAKTLELKVGMQFRFRTAVDAVSGRNQIREIWVTSVD